LSKFQKKKKQGREITPRMPRRREEKKRRTGLPSIAPDVKKKRPQGRFYPACITQKKGKMPLPVISASEKEREGGGKKRNGFAKNGAGTGEKEGCKRYRSEWKVGEKGKSLKKEGEPKQCAKREKRKKLISVFLGRGGGKKKKKKTRGQFRSVGEGEGKRTAGGGHPPQWGGGKKKPRSRQLFNFFRTRERKGGEDRNPLRCKKPRKKEKRKKGQKVFPPPKPVKGGGGGEKKKRV